MKGNGRVVDRMTSETKQVPQEHEGWPHGAEHWNTEKLPEDHKLEGAAWTKA